jgi:hypothetical protein
VGSVFWPVRFLLPVCRLSWFLYTLNIYAGVSISEHYLTVHLVFLNLQLMYNISWNNQTSSYKGHLYIVIPVNPPPFRGSLPRKSLISRLDWVSCAGDINLPHTPFPPPRSPPNKNIKYNKILTYILRSIFLEIPHLELPHWWKMPRDTNGKGV